MSKHSLVLWPLLLLLWGFGGEGGGGGCYVLFEKDFFFFFGWKIYNVSVMFLLLYVYVCVTRTGWKTRPRPKTVILPIKKSINQSSSSSSAFPAISLGFTVLLLALLRSQLDLWGSAFFGEIFAYVTVFNPTNEVVTFRLRGWCMLGMFLLPAFTRLGHEW